MGVRADDWDSPYDAVLVGLAMQAAGCAASVLALTMWNHCASFSSASTGGDGGGYAAVGHSLSLTLVMVSGIVEVLGANLASVAVKKEWVPIVKTTTRKTKDSKDMNGSRLYRDSKNKYLFLRIEFFRHESMC